MPACKTWLALPSVPHALGRESVQLSPCFVSSRLVCCFTRVVSSDRWVLFELVPRRLWRLWRFVGVKATFWRAHIVFRSVRVNSHANPLGAVPLWRFSASDDETGLLGLVLIKFEGDSEPQGRAYFAS